MTAPRKGNAVAPETASPNAASPGADLPESARGHDCWNRIGVRGNKSCERLQEYTHCRNCPVYASAAALRLERPLSSEHRESWTRHYAEPRELATACTNSALVFRIGAEWFGLPTNVFHEVAEARKPHLLPYRRGGTEVGIVNVRGDLVVHASLAALLGVSASAEGNTNMGRRAPRLLVCETRGRRIALSVDEVSGVHKYAASSVRPVPSTLGRAAVAYTRGVLELEQWAIALLDGERVLDAIVRSLA